MAVIQQICQEIASLSVRGPLRVAGKQSIRETNLISEEETKSQTQQPGSESQPMRKISMPAAEEPEGGSNAHGNQHHPANGAGPEDKQINKRQVRIANRREN